MHLVCSPLSPRLCQPPQECVRFSAWHRRGYSTAPAVAERWSVGGGVPSGGKPWGAGGNNPGEVFHRGRYRDRNRDRYGPFVFLARLAIDSSGKVLSDKIVMHPFLPIHL